ncbi:hypothetical protein P7F88_25445 [Vibrio hannami]|uniref:hypothetical protein n=1 Tax=Vibrio hannami TaxID=2717094 RepID=UPI00240F5127|nr:hypothetical protein [Vibrio hannami]MDG3089211.1 hypothetical protein [Vibrio hannami]
MKKWQRIMSEKGRSTHYIKTWFNHLSLLLSYGIKLENPECARIKAIRGEMRFKSAPRRSVAATREQIKKIVAEADRRGWGNLSLSVLLRFEPHAARD